MCFLYPRPRLSALASGDRSGRWRGEEAPKRAPGGVPVQVVDRIAPLREALLAHRLEGETIGVVPTMGYLHDGHLALVERAASECDRVVVTIFVNPTQFGSERGSRRLSARPASAIWQRLARIAVDYVFAPAGRGDVSAARCRRRWRSRPLGDMLIGAIRPGHFRGVATVVTKLFNIVQPTSAYFGEKDYQQLDDHPAHGGGPGHAGGRSSACRRCARPTGSRCRRATSG